MAELGQFWDKIPEEAQHRLKVLSFSRKYGLEATKKAFEVSRRTEKLRKLKGIEAGTLEFWAVDLVERVREGMRRYVLTMVDPSSRVAFAVAVPGKGARYTAKVLRALVEGNPGVRGLLSDNGSEFEGEFEELLPPHHSLGLKPPVRWLLENHPECQRLWTNTTP